MAKAKNGSAENLEFLADAYSKLVKAGTGSVVAAYQFGQVVDALFGLYTYRQMGLIIDKSASTVALYRKLFNAYPTETMLVQQAERLETYDISVLAGHNPVTPAYYHYACTNCGHDDAIVRVKVASGEYASKIPVVAEVVMDAQEEAHEMYAQ